MEARLPFQAIWCVELLNHQHGDIGRAENAVAYRADGAADGAKAARAHDDKVAVVVLNGIDDGFDGVDAENHLCG